MSVGRQVEDKIKCNVHWVSFLQEDKLVSEKVSIQKNRKV